jgi:tetratricopeptide (TPR) repeat protein
LKKSDIMKLLKKQFEAGQLPASELSAPEQQLLKQHLDRQLIQHWDQIIAEEDTKNRNGKRKKSILAWVSAVAITTAAALALLFYFNKEAVAVPEQQPMAMQGLVQYPFSERQVRGANNAGTDNATWQQAVLAYRNGQYTAALEKSQAMHEPFMTGMCLFMLERYEPSIEQFDLVLHSPGAPIEVRYYKGLALLQLGRKEAAMDEFRQVKESREVRGMWKDAVQKVLEGM